MRRLFRLGFGAVFFVLISNSVFGQHTTSSSGGEWTDDTYWGGSAPTYTDVNDHVIIDHRIYSNSSIVFRDGGGNKHSLTVNDTLVVYGNLTLGSFDNVNIGDNGVLIVFGDFTADVQVDVGNGGYLVVLGDYSMPSGGTSHTNTGDAKTYITGDVDVPAGNDLDCDPNVDTDCEYGDGSDLFTDPIFEFINEISDESCSIAATASIIDETALFAADGAIDVTITGGTSPAFSWSNDSITEDISGLSEGDYSLVVFDGICVIDTTFTVGGNCCGSSNYFSAENYTGNWEDVSTWPSSVANPWLVHPPPTDATGPGASQPLCVNGYVTVNGDLEFNGGSQTICDTLVVDGNFIATNPTLLVGPSGVLIILGDFDGTSFNGSINNGGRVVFVGNFDNSVSPAFSGSGESYVFDDTPSYNGTLTPTGDEDTLAVNDPALNAFVQSLISSCVDPTATIVAVSDTICDGQNISLTITFTAGTGPFDFTITEGSNPESFTNISANPYTYVPTTAPVWVDLGSNVNTSYTYTISTITDANTCTNTNQGSESIVVFKIPVTGPQYHISSTFGN